MQDMKKTFNLLVAILLLNLISNTVYAQNVIELTPFYGWQGNSKMSFYEGEIKTDNRDVAGGIMDIEMGHGYGIELMFSHTNTHSYFYPYSSYNYDPRDFDLVNQYYQIGSYKYIENGNIQPFFVASIGAARYAPDDRDIDEIWRFAMTFGAGAKIFFSDMIGIRLQASMMMPMYFSGIGFYFGTGGSGLTTYSYVPMIQGSFTAGLILRLKR